MAFESKFISLNEYIPIGNPDVSNFKLNIQKIDFDKDNDILVQNEWISVDPYMRARMTEKKNYIAPFELNKTMEGSAIGKVLESNNKNYNIGDIVRSNFGWRDKFITSSDNLEKIETLNIPIQTYLGPLGFTGHTAYIGLFKIGKLKENQTVLVSSAGGSVGSIVCQLAKIKGCMVIASTGSDEKVNWLKNEIGIDEVFNYKKIDNLVLHLKSLAPEGYDLYFDNVGGDFLESAIYRMKNFGKIVICGRISQMNNPNHSLKNIAHVLVKRLTIKGFLIFDHLNDKEEFNTDMQKWVINNKVIHKETIIKGLENTPQAFIDLLNGKNIGKMLIKI